MLVEMDHPGGCIYKNWLKLTSLITDKKFNFIVASTDVL